MTKKVVHNYTFLHRKSTKNAQKFSVFLSHEIQTGQLLIGEIGKKRIFSQNAHIFKIDPREDKDIREVLRVVVTDTKAGVMR